MAERVGRAQGVVRALAAELRLVRHDADGVAPDAAGKQRRAHKRAHAGALAADERHEDARQEGRTRGHVAEGIGGREWERAGRLPVGHRAAAQPERRAVKARLGGIGALGAEAGKVRVHKSGVGCVQRLVIETQTAQRRQADVREEHVGRLEQPEHGRLAVRIFQIDARQALAAVLDGEQRVFIVLAHDHLELTGAAHLVADPGFYFDDFRAERAQHARRGRGGDDRRQLHNANPLEGHLLLLLHSDVNSYLGMGVMLLSARRRIARPAPAPPGSGGASDR